MPNFSGIWTVTQQMQAAGQGLWVAEVTGQQQYTCGSYTWVAPTGVTSVSAVVVGSGARNLGGSLRYKNNITVVPGNSYTVVAGLSNRALTGNNSYFISTTTLLAKGGGVSVTQYGDGGGCAGTSSGNGGASGAGGYSGNGGNGGASGSSGTAGSGGGGGGGGTFGVIGGCCNWYGGGGGGVGLLGQGSSGAGGVSGGGGGAGSGGSAGQNSPVSGIYGGNGGNYGGGLGCSNSGVSCGSTSGGGAVRIIWPGTTRSFPSTCTGNL